MALFERERGRIGRAFHKRCPVPAPEAFLPLSQVPSSSSSTQSAKTPCQIRGIFYLCALGLALATARLAWEWALWLWERCQGGWRVVGLFK